MKMYRFLLMVMAVLFTALVTQTPAYAQEEKERCIKPRFRNFNPPNHAEVAPGTEISFHVKNADKTKIEVSAKKIPLAINIEDRHLFLIVTAKLPESLHNTYARISLKAAAEQGCKSKDGWLVKITDTATATDTQTDETRAAASEADAKAGSMDSPE